MANSIDIAQDAVNKSIKNIESSIDKIAKSLQANNEAIILASQKAVDKENESKKKTADTIIEKNEDSAEKINADQLSNAQKISQTISSGVGKAFNDITSKFKSMLEQYTNEQQKLAFNLLGTGFSYMDMRNALSVLSTNTILKQNDVYKNLTDLVSNGINLNAAQRAFLKTASDQVNLGFQANEAALNRLIQLQRTDLSEARVAQMAGLRKFLEQNYQNSQYIRQGFADVSAALFEMQSLMSSQLAMSVEQSIQTYLGSFAAAGGNTGTATNIAQAIGKIGSGDFSDLGNMQNLMVMAASRAGLSYADILNNGISENDSKKLMNAMMGYIGSIGNVGGGSNAAMNAMAKLFGVSVSDIKAAQNMNLSAANTGYTSSINQFLYDLASSTNESTQIANWWANGISNQALTTPLGLVGYNLLEGLSSMAGGIIKETETDTLLGSIFGTNTGKSAIRATLGSLVTNAPALGILGSILFNKDAGGDNYFQNLFSAEGIGQIASGGLDNIIQTLLTGKGSSTAAEELINAYSLIGGFNNEKTFRTSGSFSAGPGISTSGSMTNGGAQSGGIGGVNVANIVQGYEDETPGRTINDIYDLLNEDFIGTEWMTVPRIIANPGVGAENSIWLGSHELTAEIAKQIGDTALSNRKILELLEDQFGYLQEALAQLATKNTYSYGDVFGVPL